MKWNSVQGDDTGGPRSHLLPWTHQIYSYTWKIPSEETQIQPSDPCTWGEWENPHIKTGGKAQTHSCLKPHFWQSSIQSMGVRGLTAPTFFPGSKRPNIQCPQVGDSHLKACVLSRFSPVQLFVTPWIGAQQAPLSMGFSRQEYWSGLPCPPPGDLPKPGIEPMSLMSPALGLLALSCLTLCDPMNCSPPCSSIHGILQERDSSFRGSSQPRELNLGLLHCRQILYDLSYQGNPLEGWAPKEPCSERQWGFVSVRLTKL